MPFTTPFFGNILYYVVFLPNNVLALARFPFVKNCCKSYPPLIWSHLWVGLEGLWFGFPSRSKIPVVFSALLGVLSHQIWLARNSYRFENVPSDVLVTFRKARSTFRFLLRMHKRHCLPDHFFSSLACRLPCWIHHRRGLDSFLQWLCHIMFCPLLVLLVWFLLCSSCLIDAQRSP